MANIFLLSQLKYYSNRYHSTIGQDDLVGILPSSFSIWFIDSSSTIKETRVELTQALVVILYSSPKYKL